MCCLLSPDGDVRAQRDSTSKTRVALLGTGTPSPDPERSRPATAIVVNDTKTLGRPNEVDGYKVNAYEIVPGIVYQDSNVKVTAFLVRHGEVPGAFGYRFETPDRSIVISGDAAPSQTIIDQCNACDVLMHEAYSLMTYNGVTRPYQEYREKHHTSSRELAELATEARPT
jgi:ribonuclease BN (tRNA processing enzyme)